MSTIAFAPDSFKGSLDQAAVVDAMRAGWSSVRPGDELVSVPMADGGEGTIAAIAASVAGAERIPVTVPGPHGGDMSAHWLLLPEGTGVVELASTSGIELLGERLRPWDADTSGFGAAVTAALDAGVGRLILGIGSSASTDAGIGVLRALGARFADASGADVPSGARGLREVASADLSALRPPPERGAIVLSDVTNPLVGERGAAAVFGPQKGFVPEEIAVVDDALARFAPLIPSDPTAPGAGAAGGTGFALAAWGAHVRPGARNTSPISWVSPNLSSVLTSSSPAKDRSMRSLRRERCPVLSPTLPARRA